MKKILVILLAGAILAATAACSTPAAEPPASQEAPPAQAATAAPSAEPAATIAPVETPIPTASPEVAETPANDNDLVTLIAMTRADVEAKYGAGTPVEYETYIEYMESGEIIGGFAVKHANLANVIVFYDAEIPSDEASPYTAKPKPDDPVLGIRLLAGSAPLHVKNYTAEIAAADLSAHKGDVTEYEGRYLLEIPLDNMRAVWVSASKDMTETDLCVYES